VLKLPKTVTSASAQAVAGILAIVGNTAIGGVLRVMANATIIAL